MTNRQVAERFAEGIKDSGHSENMFFEHEVIYSYGYHFPMAFKVSKNIALFNSYTYSNTTAKHLNHVRRALYDKGYKFIEVPTDIIKEYMDKFGNKNEVMEKGKEYLASEFNKAISKFERAKVEHMREYWLSEQIRITAEKIAWVNLFI